MILNHHSEEYYKLIYFSNLQFSGHEEQTFVCYNVWVKNVASAYHPSLNINFIKESCSGKYMDRPDNDAVDEEIRIIG